MQTYARFFRVFAAFTLAACGNDPSPGTTGNSDTAGLTFRGVMRVGQAWVNGVPFDVSQARVTVDGLPSTPSALASGMVVRISGSIDDGQGTAETADEQNEVRGAIEAMTDDGFTLLGQTVVVGDQTVWGNVSGLTGLALGDLVEVHGNRDTAGIIHATRVELESGDDNGAVDEIRGVITGLDDTTFSIGDLLVDFSSATIEPVGTTLSEGDLVEVHGQLDGTTFVATRIEVEDHLDDGIADDSASLEVRIEANIDSIDETTISALGLEVALASTTDLEAGLAAGDGVNIEAHLDADGFSLTAIRVERQSNPVRTDDNELRGPVAVADEPTLTVVIAGVTIDLSSAELQDRNEMPMSAEDFFAALSGPTTVVQARGELVDGVLIADEAELE